MPSANTQLRNINDLIGVIEIQYKELFVVEVGELNLE